MAKSQQVRLLEKQIKQDKNAERKREREARQEAIRMRAASVVNGQPFVAGFRIMDATAEEVDAEYANLATAYGLDADKVKELVEADAIKSDLCVKKAVDFVKENASITTK